MGAVGLIHDEDLVPGVDDVRDFFQLQAAAEVIGARQKHGGNGRISVQGPLHSRGIHATKETRGFLHICRQIREMKIQGHSPVKEGLVGIALNQNLLPGL